jgi:16S rRNA (uracil1498-N3)-methyltransferase
MAEGEPARRAPRFYLDAPLHAGESCTLAEESAHHAVHVLRLRAGDEATLFNGRGGEFAARIASVQKLKLTLDVLEHRAIERESPLRVTLIQGISSGERMEFTIRKAVELGVAEIRPVLAATSVARPKGERAAARQSHWQRIAISACEQCGRNRIPVVHPLSTLPSLSGSADFSCKILLSPKGDLTFSKAVKDKGPSFMLAAGPEAGFTAEEEAIFVSAGFVQAKLGARVLRTETAALAALASLNALLGDY